MPKSVAEVPSSPATSEQPQVQPPVTERRSGVDRRDLLDRRTVPVPGLNAGEGLAVGEQTLPAVRKKGR
ncbi:MAG: hypothetical protein HC898_00685 [Phycisphaerales bacterium]|nr:hypothetical protein [Phycisphaerales bacterium]